VGGRKMCDLARRGEKVKVKPSKVKIYETRLLSYEWPIAEVRIKCSSGTYIRSIAHDLGDMLGCGGYLRSLRRVAIGSFSIEDARDLCDIGSLDLPELLFF
jgi:tRNA pseudouridine55 synthase